jgi:hypothetical protein
VNYKETLYFIAKCLTISLEAKNKQEIEKQLKSTCIDWDAVVKVSTAHFVFPALYCNLKRADFLLYLPHELVNYMEHITDINKERNKQIIAQANELNNFLLANNIRPIFLKGTGNLLAGLYEDIAERMVGDIDFIFSKKDYPRAIAVLREFGYYEVKKRKYHYPDIDKHYRRLQKDKSIAAIEIHSELLGIKKYSSEFNYSFVEKDCQALNGVNVLSYANKLNLSIIANQINEHFFEYKTIVLRNAYDVFLLSKKTSAKNAVHTLDKLTNPLNCFLAACFKVFDRVESLVYGKNSKTASYLSDFNSQFTNTVKTKRRHKRIKAYLLLKDRLKLIYKCFIYKECRLWLLNLLTEKEFYKRRLVELKKSITTK